MAVKFFAMAIAGVMADSCDTCGSDAGPGAGRFQCLKHCPKDEDMVQRAMCAVCCLTCGPDPTTSTQPSPEPPTTPKPTQEPTPVPPTQEPTPVPPTPTQEPSPVPPTREPTPEPPTPEPIPEPTPEPPTREPIPGPPRPETTPEPTPATTTLEPTSEPVPAGHPIELTWDDCGGESAHAKVTDLSPTTLKIGHNTLTASGTVDAEVAGGTFSFVAKAGPIPVLKGKGDLCGETTIDFPLKAGSIVFKGVQCPVASGPVEIGLDVNIATTDQESNALINIKVEGQATNGDKVFCVNVHTNGYYSSNAAIV